MGSIEISGEEICLHWLVAGLARVQVSRQFAQSLAAPVPAVRGTT